MSMPKFIEKMLKKWCLKRYPLEVTTKVINVKYYHILVKKGKIKQWRIYDEHHNRIG